MADNIDKTYNNRLSSVDSIEKSKINIKSEDKPYDEQFLDRYPAIRQHADLFFSAISVVLYSIVATLVKSVKIYDPHISSLAILLYRGCTQLVLVLPPTYYYGIPLFFVKDYNLLLFFRGLSGWLDTVTIYSAYHLIALSDASALQATSPVFVFLVSAIFLHEPMSLVKCCAPILSFAGTVLIVRPTFIFEGLTSLTPEQRSNLNLGVILALSNAIIQTSTLIFIRKVKDVPTLTVTNWYSIWCASGSFLALAITDSELFTREVPWQVWLFCTLLSFVGTLSQIFLKFSLKYGNPSLIVITRSTVIVICFIIDMIIFHTEFHFFALLGSMLIIGSVLILASFSPTKSKPKLEPEPIPEKISILKSIKSDFPDIKYYLSSTTDQNDTK